MCNTVNLKKMNYFFLYHIMQGKGMSTALDYALHIASSAS